MSTRSVPPCVSRTTTGYWSMLTMPMAHGSVRRLSDPRTLELDCGERSRLGGLQACGAGRRLWVTPSGRGSGVVACLPRGRRGRDARAAAGYARKQITPVALAEWLEGVAPSALVSDSARPPWLDDDRDQWRWLCAAVEPTTGDAVALSLSRTAPLVCKPFSMPSGGAVRRMPAGRSPLVLDGSGNHTGAQVRWPGGLQRSRLPPLSPKLKSGRALV